MKILIMEDPRVLPVILDYLNEIDQVHGGCADLIVCRNKSEAEARLAEANMAIIDIDCGGHEVVIEALERYGIPVMATSAILDEGTIKKTGTFCCMTKPAIGFEDFRSAILQFQKIVERKVSVTWRTQHFREELDAGSDTCVLN